MTTAVPPKGDESADHLAELLRNYEQVHGRRLWLWLNLRPATAGNYSPAWPWTALAPTGSPSKTSAARRGLSPTASRWPNARTRRGICRTPRRGWSGSRGQLYPAEAFELSAGWAAAVKRAAAMLPADGVDGV